MYLGKPFSLVSGTLGEARLNYDPDDLTTHAVCVGMTGSGKTGLCIDLLEEAALAGIPAILIDPKGDITNLLLQFPDLAPADFRPWVSVDEARRAKLGLDGLAAQTATRWREGLTEWGLTGEDIRRLQASAEWAIYTPGSDAGRPLSILKSLERPDLPWDDNQELLRERIAGVCAGLLGLVGLEADPVKSREHILLANLFEHAWRNDQTLTLETLIAQVQTPPFERLGVLELERFYPEKDRLALALALNAIIAAPTFGTWLNGDPLDVSALLHTPTGKPRLSILYVAHLSDAERMFVITLVLEQLVSWLRTQPGSAALRALLYFDEVYGYFPPYPRNPPTKAPLMRLLKQARAFGLGVMLVTQNPGDLDYKGLTNAGTWFIGKLQTERDKARLLEGLQTIAGQGLEADSLSDMISALPPRTFILNNVHQPGPQVFQTRWAMAYLAGPLTREQIRVFKPAGPPPPPAATASRTSRRADPAPHPTTPASIPASVPQHYFLPSRTAEQALADWRTAQPHQPNAAPAAPPRLLYRAGLWAQASVRYVLAKADLNTDQTLAFWLPDPHESGLDWATYRFAPLTADRLTRERPPADLWATPDPDLPNAKRYATWQKELISFLVHSATLSLHHNPTLKLFARPGQSFADFRALCQQQAALRRDEAWLKQREPFARKLVTLESRMRTQQLDVEKYERELAGRERQGGFEMLSTFLGKGMRRTISDYAYHERRTSDAKAQLEKSRQLLAHLTEQQHSLQAAQEAAHRALMEQWHSLAQDYKEVRVTPKRSDILVTFFGVGWRPFWQVELGDQTLELPA